MRDDRPVLWLTMACCLLESRPSWGSCEGPPEIDELVRSAAVVLTGTASSVEPDPATADHECVWFLPDEYLKGAGTPDPHRICYPLNRRRARLEAVLPGERVLVFASAEANSELSPSAAQTSVISPSNVSCALGWGLRFEFDAVEQTVRRGVGYVEGDPETQRQIAIELAESGGVEMLQFLRFQAAAWRERPLEYDPATVIPHLLESAMRGNPLARYHAFETATIMDGRGPASRLMYNEVMDVAIELMGDDDEGLRRSGWLHFQNRACPTRIPDEVHRCVQSFGYDPLAPAAGREEGLRRARDWWAAQRGQGRFDTSPERIAELKAQDAEARRRDEESRRRFGEDLVYRIQHGLETIDLSNPRSKYQLRDLAAAGYELAPDGSVVPVGSVQPSVGGDGADLDAIAGDAEACDPEIVIPSDADAGEADEGGDGTGGGPEKRRGCGCAVPGGGSPAAPLVALWSVAFVAALRTGRRRG